MTAPLPTLRGPVRAVLFDVDDTLVNTRGAFAHALGRIAAVYLPELPAERHADLLVTWRTDAGGHYRAYTRGEVDARTQRMRRANELHALYGGPVLDDGGFDRWDAVFREAFAEGWAPFDDASALVRGLAGRGLRLGALSNAPVEHQVAKLAHVGLGEQVPMLVGVDTLGFGKPDPRVFAAACRLAGVDPARAVYVGDELDIDARAAAEAGLQGVWLDRPGARRGGPHLEDPDVAVRAGVPRIRSLDELAAMLEPVVESSA